MEFRNMLNSRIADAGGKYDEHGVIQCTRAQFKAGAERAARQFEAILPKKSPAAGRSVTPADFGIMEMLDALVLDPMRREGRYAEVSSILSGSNPQALFEAINTTQFPRLLNRMAAVTILDEYEISLENVDALVTEVPNWSQDWYHTNALTGQDSPTQTQEGSGYEETILGEYDVSIQLFKYGRLLYITREMILADATGKVLERAKSNGQYMALTRQQEILSTCTGVASTINTKAAIDNLIINNVGRALYANDHSALPGSGGETNDNLIASALSSAGLQTAVTALRQIKDIHGRRIKVNPTQLIHAPAQEVTAGKLFSFAVEPGLASGGIDPNIYRSKYRPVLDMEGVDGTWYLGDFAKQIRYVWGWKPEVVTGVPEALNITHDIVVVIRPSYKGGCGAVDHKFAIKSVG